MFKVALSVNFLTLFLELSQRVRYQLLRVIQYSVSIEPATSNLHLAPRTRQLLSVMTLPTPVTRLTCGETMAVSELWW